MQRTLTILVTFSLCGGAMHGEDSPQSVRLRFEAVDTHRECGGGANFTRLCPAPGRPGALFAIVHAGLNDTFPIRSREGDVVFRVTVPAATDEQFTLQIKTKAGKVLRTITLIRDKPVTVNVAGDRFEFYYPTVQVSSTGKRTTNKALLLITRLPAPSQGLTNAGQSAGPDS